MRTKKELYEAYREQLSVNRITDQLFCDVREYFAVKEGIFNPSVKDVVDKAYTVQDMIFNSILSDFETK